MSIIRVNKNKDNPYVMINKGFLEDSNLSFKAKGILTYLLSKPDNWTCQVKDLQNKGKDGRDSIYNGLKELREHGYLIKKPLRDKEGRIKEWEEEVFEVPQTKAKEVYKKQVNSRSLTIYGKSVKGKTVKGKGVNIISNEFNNNEFNNNNNNNNTNTTQQVVSSNNNRNKNLIEAYTHLQLSSNMSRQVVSWKYERLEEAIRIFKKQDGERFALLKKIYEDDGNFVKKNTSSSAVEEINAKSFNNFPAREYDFDSLEAKLLGWDKD